MAQWGLTDVSTNTYLRAVSGYGNKTSNTSNRDAFYNNVSVSAAGLTMQAGGLYGVDAREAQNTAASQDGKKVTHAGWVIRKAGVGPVLTLGANAVGASMANNAAITISNGVVNAVATVQVNATGNATGITIVSGGMGFINTAAIAVNLPANSINSVTVSAPGGLYANGDLVIFGNTGTAGVDGVGVLVTNSSGNISSVTIVNGGRNLPSVANTTVVIRTVLGTGATLAPVINAGGSGLTLTGLAVLGGRSGRVFYETLVAHGSIATSNTGDNAFFPG